LKGGKKEARKNKGREDWMKEEKEGGGWKEGRH
jgi:hypothetical protein